MGTWEDLEARREELREREKALTAEMAAMDPLMAARAFSTLADQKDALAAEYEEHLRRGLEGKGR